MLKLRVRLIDGWRKAGKFWSIRLGVVGSALTSVFILWPESALYFWGAMPDEVKAWIPEQFIPMIGVSIFVMSMFARVVKQQKLESEPNDEQPRSDTVEDSSETR